MRTFNENFLKPIDSRELQTRTDGSLLLGHPDLVSEFGIQISRQVIGLNQPLEIFVENSEALLHTWNRAQSLVARHEKRSIGFNPIPIPIPIPIPMSDACRTEGERLARNLVAFVKSRDATSHFAPRIPGSSVISECEADLSVGETLVEIKTVSRTFRSSDLRQLIVYLALDWVRGPRWTRGCLLNPKRATWADFDIDSLVRLLSGRSASESLPTLLHSFERGVGMDALLF